MGYTQRSSTAGTTMVEIVLAMTVASIVVAMAAVALLRGHQATIAARDQAEAGRVMEFITTRFQTAKFESVLGAAGGGHLAGNQNGYPNPSIVGSTTAWRNSAGYSGYPNNYMVRWSASPMRQTLQDILAQVTGAGFTAFRVEVSFARRDYSDLGDSGDSSVSDFTAFVDRLPAGAPDGVDDFDDRLMMRDCNNDNDLMDICPDGMSEMPATNLRQLNITLFKGTTVAARSTVLVSSEKLTGDNSRLNESALRFEIKYPIGSSWFYQNTPLTEPHLNASDTVPPFFRRYRYKDFIENYTHMGKLGSLIPVDDTAYNSSGNHAPGYYNVDLGPSYYRTRHDPLFEIRTEPGHYFEFTYGARNGFLLAGGTMTAGGQLRYLIDGTRVVSGTMTLQATLMQEAQHNIWGRARHGDLTSPWTYRMIRTDATPPVAKDIDNPAFTNPRNSARVRTRTPVPWIVVEDSPTVAGQGFSGLVPEVTSMGTSSVFVPTSIADITYRNYLIRNAVPNPSNGYKKSMELVLIDTTTLLPYELATNGLVFLRAEFGDLTYYKTSTMWRYRACVPPSVDPHCPADTANIDTSSPTVKILSPLPGTTVAPGVAPLISFKLADPESGIDPKSVRILIDGVLKFNATDLGMNPQPGAAYTFGADSLPEPGTPESGGFTVNFSTGVLTFGPHTVEVQVKNWGDNTNWNDSAHADATWTFNVP